MSTRPILILAGGTGGHVIPALAVAEVFRRRSVPVHWLGGAAGIEVRMVSAAGIPFTALPGRGLRGTGLGRKLLGPPRLVGAVARAWRLIRRLRPRAALGFGGYASGAGGIAAWLARCPLVVHEQNAIAGYTNRALGRFAVRVLTGFPDTRDLAGEFVGNPIRGELAGLAPPALRYGERQGPLHLLVIGGSQGAQILNETVPAALARCQPGAFEVRHLAGSAHVESSRRAYRAAGVTANVEGFSDDMPALYAWADLAIARAGALSLAEFATVGLPAILVPYPAAVDDHQSVNARAFVAAGAARLLPQAQCDPATLGALLEGFQAGGRAPLAVMAEAARGLARPDAAERVAAAVLEVARA